MNCILIADSGSTKTDWILKSRENGTLEVSTTGINPVRDSESAILCVLKQELLTQLPDKVLVDEIHFYGAGCIQPFSQHVEQSLHEAFPEAQISVDSDLLGAARALCGHKEGIACILGTGANSCYYDGKEIVRNVSPLGFILGDEGSGAVLGRTLLGNLLKDMMTPGLKEKFLEEYKLTPADIINKVYRQPQPNKFLASLVPFICKNRKDATMQEMVTEAFRQFLKRNVAAYKHPEMPVNFVGGVAFSLQEELCEALKQEDMKLGKILRKPVQEIANFHQKG